MVQEGRFGVRHRQRVRLHLNRSECGTACLCKASPGTLSIDHQHGTAELLSHPQGQIIESFRGRFLNHAGCLIACI